MARYNLTANSEHSEFSVSGILERVTYHNEENGYTVGRLAIEGERDLITVVGSFTNPIVGEMLVCEGQWVANREYGRQFAMHRYRTTKPATAFAIQKYLGSGLIRGVGPVMARRMVDLFQTETLEIIDSDPRKLLRVDGIGEKRVAMIKKAWHEQREIRNVMLFLQEKGVSSTYAVKIYKRYGDQSIQVVEENPYRLAQDIWGIGFKTADKIAQQIGIAPDSPRRLEAGLLYTLSQATDFGHMYLPDQKLLTSSSEILTVERELLAPVLEEMIATDQVKAEAVEAELQRSQTIRAIFHPGMFFTEVGLAREIVRRLAIPLDTPISRAKIQMWLERQTEMGGAHLSDEQHLAVSLALENRIFVLTGGPGTGKTLTTNTIMRAFEARKRRIVLCSPTGRAAKRLSEVTGREAQTIHRMLKFAPLKRAFHYNDMNPLECDVLIADEVSMLDAVLAYNLLKAVPDSAQIVFVGDSDQLPSVGAGNVLQDILTSGMVSSTRLTQVFRQAENSLIVTNAHRIRRGEFPVLVPPQDREGKNCLFIEVNEPEEQSENPNTLNSSELAAKQVVKAVRRTLPALGYRGDDVQVLSPMHRGAAGVGILNELLQDAMNPPDASGAQSEMLRGSRRFRVGDRVIQLVNNYEKNVFNGDVGTLVEIKTVDQVFIVRFPDADVAYDFAEYDELQLAYAMSVHKSQGSEYRAVVLVFHSSQYMMLQRNLLYTGLTRAREICLIVGDRRAIARAVRNDKTAKRYTRLSERLRAKAS